MKERPILFNGPMVRAILEGRKTQTRLVVKWKRPEPGLNLAFSGLSVGHYDTGNPSSGYVLYSRRGDGVWEQRTNPTFCPYGQPGDRLWVRETGWELGRHYQSYPEDDEWKSWSSWGEYFYAADGLPPVRGANDWGIKSNTDEDGKPLHFIPCQGGLYWRKRPSIHMPRWASRITLEITAVRVERVQDISEADAKAEGILELGDCSPPNYDTNAKQYSNGLAVGFKTARDAFKKLWDSINAANGFGWDKNPWVWVVEFRRINQ